MTRKPSKQRTRIDGRAPDQLRAIRVTRGFTKAPAGSVLIQAGDTHVLCTATIEEAVPKWRESSGKGWVSAEYEMLPGSTSERKPRSRSGKVDGRTQEIQRLIGRSLRAVVDMAMLGPRTLWIDCDVLQADGGTRTLAITGAWVALHDAATRLQRNGQIVDSPITDSVAAVSVGLVGGRVLLDLCYEEDRQADVDFNVVLTGSGRFVEVQGAAEAGTFTRPQMNRLVSTAETGIRQLRKIQMDALSRRLPR